MPVSDTNKRSLDDLLKAFDDFDHVEKSLFPGPLKRALIDLLQKRKNDPYTLSTDDVKNVCLTFKHATGLRNAPFSCLSVFRQSPLMQAFSDLEHGKLLSGPYREEYLNAIIESDYPAAVSLAITWPENGDILRTGDPSFFLANLRTISESKNPIAATSALSDCMKLQILPLSSHHNFVSSSRNFSLSLNPTAIHNCIKKYDFPDSIPNALQNLSLHGLLNASNVELIDTQGNQQFLWVIEQYSYEIFKPIVNIASENIPEIIEYNQWIFVNILNTAPNKKWFIAEHLRTLHEQNIFVNQAMMVCILNAKSDCTDGLLCLNKAGLFDSAQALSNIQKIMDLGHKELLLVNFLDAGRILRPWVTWTSYYAELLRDALESEHGFTLLFGQTATFWKSTLFQDLNDTILERNRVFSKICEIVTDASSFEEGKSTLDNYLSEISSTQSQSCGFSGRAFLRRGGQFASTSRSSSPPRTRLEGSYQP